MSDARIVSTMNIPQEVGRLALKLHKRRSTDLVIDCDASSLPSGGTGFPDRWRVTDGRLEFFSLEARNTCTAAHRYHEVFATTATVEFAAIFDEAHALWSDEIGHGDLASGRFLALASNKFNVLSEATKLIETGTQRVFDVLHIVEAALPYLPSIMVNDLTSLIVTQYPKTQNDSARGMIFTAIEKVLIRQRNLADDIYRQTKNNLTEATVGLYTTALLALCQTVQRKTAIDHAIQDALADAPLVAQAALWVLSRVICIGAENSEIRARCVETIRRQVDHSDPEIRMGAIRALASAASSERELLRDLLTQANRHEQEVLLRVADLLFMDIKTLKTHPLLPELLATLAHLRPESGRTVETLDYILASLMKDEGDHSLVYHTLTKWVANNGDAKRGETEFGNRFSQTLQEFVNRVSPFETLFTEWLMASDRRLVAAAAESLDYLEVHGFTHPRFSREVLDRLDHADIKLLVRRMLGYVFSEKPLLSLTSSLLDTSDVFTRTAGFVYSLLTNEVGKDFPDATLRAIETQRETVTGPLKNMLNEAHGALSAYMNAIDALPQLRELIPPLRLQRALERRKRRMQQRIMEEADRKSIFRLIATEVPIKGGIGCFTVSADGVGETHRLQSISHVATLPRRSVIDPVGYEIAGLHYRIATRDEP